MTEVANFLLGQLKDDSDARRYLAGLLTKSLPKLEKEKTILTAEEATADKQLDTQAIKQSKICFQCSQSLTQIRAQCSEFLTLSASAQKLVDSSLANLQSANGSQVLWHLRHLKAVKSQQAALSEILEIPTMLHTLHAAGMYEEMLNLIKYAKSTTKVCTSPLMEKLIVDADEYQRLLEASLQGELASTLDESRTRKALKLIEELLGDADDYLCKLYLAQRLQYFTAKTEVKTQATAFLCNYSASLVELVLALNRDQALFRPERKLLFDLFLFDRVTDLLDIFKERLNQVERLTDLKSVYNALNFLNENALNPSGVGLSRELSSLILTSTCLKISDFAQRVQSNFEGMLRLYQWDNSGQRDNPLLKFGGIAVLYNNCIYLINEVRQFRLAETEAVFCAAMANLFVNVANFVVQRGQHLRGPGPRTPQQNVYRGLFFEFVDILRQHAFPPLMAGIRETFPNSQVKPKFDEAMEVLQAVNTTS